jgi:hypothetical protein
MTSATSRNVQTFPNRSTDRRRRSFDDGRRGVRRPGFYDAIAECHPKAGIIVPPRITAVAVETTAKQRDKHFSTIAEHGRMSWQRSSDYNRRSLVETTMFRYKTVISRRLRARTLPNQRTEAKVGCNVLNRMTGLGMPVSRRDPLTRKPIRRHTTASLFVHQSGFQ